MANEDPYGDGGGARVGRPDTPERKREGGGRAGGSESGDEAARGIHSRNEGGEARRPGSEPLVEREEEHESGYGGRGGEARTSSDQRTPPRDEG